jgi:hypothetical protein
MNVTLEQMKAWNAWVQRSAEKKRKEALAAAVRPVLERRAKGLTTPK